MLTTGIDLAADDAKTAIAAIRWSGTSAQASAQVDELVVGADDAAVLDAIRRCDKAGVDCPLGWPATFVKFVVAQEAGDLVLPQDSAGRAWRRSLAYRRTDLAIHEALGIWPMSVAADRIAHVAMRCAGLLARLAADGLPVDRSGAGVVVEVYPAASLRRWGLEPFRRYKGTANAERLDALVSALAAAAPWLRLGAYEAVCRRCDHALDAVLAALTARAAALGQTAPPSGEEAAVEGWIALPDRPLDDLRGT
jgi:predicted nuclease with RNAse H fold